MSAVINLRHEPKLREQLEYAQAVNNTVLIDRRTRWAIRFESRTESRMPRPSPATASISGSASRRAR